MASRGSKKLRGAVLASGIVLAALLLIDVSFRVLDARTRLASVRNLQSVQAAAAQYGLTLEDGANWQVELVRVGAVDEEQLRDPRSGQAITIVKSAAVPGDADVSGAVMAFTPVSDSRFAWWFAAYGRSTRGGGILYGDGHARWHVEQEFQRIVASAEGSR